MDMNQINTFRKTVRTLPVFGPFCKTCDPAIIETLGITGFDFVILDMEHGPNSVETIQHLIRAAEAGKVLPIVRTPSADPEIISKVLDIGAGGIQIPQITCADDVHCAVESARFAPQGERGVCRYVRAAGYSSVDKNTYFKKANNALIIIQLEGKKALKNLDDILCVKGPDIVFVGPYDLSQSLGVPGRVDHPDVIRETRRIVAACRERDIAVGNFTEHPDQTKFWIDKGLTYMSFSVDVGIVYEAGKQVLSKLKTT